MDICSYFECRGKGSREIGEWMRDRYIILANDWVNLNVLESSWKVVSWEDLRNSLSSERKMKDRCLRGKGKGKCRRGCGKF